MEEQRLQKIIADRGFCSRRKAEEYISDGRVNVNGKTVDQLGMKFPIDVKITIDGKEVSKKQDTYTYIVLNKPTGVITTAADDRGRKTVLDLMPPKYGRLFPVGRLDINTHGAILLTNDGEFANLVMHPSSSLDKTYRAKIEGRLTEAQKKMLEQGVKLEDGLTAPAKIKEVMVFDDDTSIVELIIHEGKKREVRRMLQYAGHPVIDLERKLVGHIGIEGMRRGEYREIPLSEITKIKNQCLKNKVNNKHTVTKK